MLGFVVSLLNSLSAQDQHYSNERIFSGFPQFYKAQGLNVATDGFEKIRYQYKQGEFYYDNFLAGMTLSINQDQYFNNLFWNRWFCQRLCAQRTD